MSVSVNYSETGDGEQTFVSGSCDATAKLWDIRTNEVVMTFAGHDSDVNSVDFFPDGKAIVTASDDSSCRLFDIRACGQLNKYMDPTIVCGTTSVKFSHSGAYIFAGYDDKSVCVWDTIHAETAHKMEKHHEFRVSSLDVTKDGTTFCTGSWDQVLNVYA